MFRAGLERHGFKVHEQTTGDPREGDIFVTWNRIRDGHETAKRFEEAGATVLVAENATWGNDFQGRRWYHIARGRHNTTGCFDVGGPERFDRLGVDLSDWRKGGETVILPSRGIGTPPQAMPYNWTARHEGRVRPHPGTRDCKPLREDLAQAGKVITWGSGAAVLACIWGIPVHSDIPNWIGHQSNTDASRLAMLRSLAHAQWTHEEISNGYAFERLLRK